MSMPANDHNDKKQRTAARVYNRPKTADLARYRVVLIVAAVFLTVLITLLIYWLRHR